MQRLAGRRYYYNEDSGESTFTRPRESIGALQAEDDDHSSYCGAAAARDALVTMTDGRVDTTGDEGAALPDSSARCRPPLPSHPIPSHPIPSPPTHFLILSSPLPSYSLPQADQCSWRTRTVPLSLTSIYRTEKPLWRRWRRERRQ